MFEFKTSKASYLYEKEELKEYKNLTFDGFSEVKKSFYQKEKGQLLKVLNPSEFGGFKPQLGIKYDVRGVEIKKPDGFKILFKILQIREAGMRTGVFSVQGGKVFDKDYNQLGTSEGKGFPEGAFYKANYFSWEGEEDSIFLFDEKTAEFESNCLEFEVVKNSYQMQLTLNIYHGIKIKEKGSSAFLDIEKFFRVTGNKVKESSFLYSDFKLEGRKWEYAVEKSNTLYLKEI
jgi:hypothetical protein